MSYAMPNSRRDGFTLIELIVVLILLAVSAGVVMPILRPPVREDTREPEFAGLLRVARQAAAERGQLLQLSVSANGDWLVFAPTPDKVEVLSRGSMTQPHVALNVSIS
ncbi:MAG TPA: type II secretion system protein, partial [Longimicrobiales bacterium]